MQKLIFRIAVFIAIIALYFNIDRFVRDENVLFYLNKIITFVIITLGLSILSSMLIFYHRSKKRLSLGRDDNVVVGVKNIYNVIFTVALFLLILSFWNIDLKTLFTSISIFAAAIVILFKDYISPIISGFIMAFSSDLSIGDNVKIGSQKGKIVNINISKLALLTEDDDVIFIPNDKVYLSEIINYTKVPIKRISIPFILPSSTVDSVDDLEKELIETLSEYAENINQSSLNLKVVDINKDQIEFKFLYSLDQVNLELEKEIRKKTIRKVIEYITFHKLVPSPRIEP